MQFYIDGATAGSPVAVTTTNGVTTAFLTPSAPLSVGSHAITATFTSAQPTLFFSSSTAQASSVTIAAAGTRTALAATSPRSPSVFGEPLLFLVSAVSPGAGVPTGVVQFADTTTGANLGSAVLVNGLATMPITALAVGSYAITATYQGDGNFLSSSNATPVQQTVTPAATTATVSTNLSILTLVQGNPLDLTAVVSARSPSLATPTGTVQFQVDGANVGDPQPVDQTGTATFTLDTEALSIGWHTLSRGLPRRVRQLFGQHRRRSATPCRSSSRSSRA